MIPACISVRAARGFDAECLIPLSPNLTVVYGGNGRGKTSLCEAWNWVFTGEMLQGLEPRSELASAGQNIHSAHPPLVRLLSGDGTVLIQRGSTGLNNPGELPLQTSPVLLQYRLQQVLYASQGERRTFFEQVLELEVEGAFAQKLRRIAQDLDPLQHAAWLTWQRAVGPFDTSEFRVPHPSPRGWAQQSANAEALMRFVSGHLGCDPSLEAIEAALQGDEGGSDPSTRDLRLPLSDSFEEQLSAALAAITNLDREAERALARARWRRKGADDFVDGMECPFCGERTITDEKLRSIREQAVSVEERHRTHRVAQERLETALSAALPLAELDVPAALDKLAAVETRLRVVGLDTSEPIFAAIPPLRAALVSLRGDQPEPERRFETGAFERFAPAALNVSRNWIAFQAALEPVEDAFRARRTRARCIQAATMLMQYSREDLASFKSRLEAAPILREIADVAPAAVNQLKEQRLGELAADILRFYRLLRPDDPTPLEELQASAGVRGDVRILARSRDKVAHASALFSFSNANALGMAAHVARVLNGGHKTVVFDDPFQSLDDTNRDQVVQRLVAELLGSGVQVVILTHDRGAAGKLLNLYADRGVVGVDLYVENSGTIRAAPRLPGNDRLLSVVLDGIEADNPAEIDKVVGCLRQLVESFCLEYLAALGAPRPPARARNLGGLISELERLPVGARPTHHRMQILRDWNQVLSEEAHGAGSAGMDQLKGVTRDALHARGQERQLRPPGQSEWKPVPAESGLRARMARVLGDG